MLSGTIFDIKEFALNDGPGVRLTVFMKGCPLCCKWCHNPEGISATFEINKKTNLVCGKKITSNDLISQILKFSDIFNLSGGGVTFSGGEPTAQYDFLMEVLDGLKNIHKVLDTSGYCEKSKFENLCHRFDLIYFDLKLINESLHKEFTKVSNKVVLKNLEFISNSNIPYHIRVPLIPTITDTVDNLLSIVEFISVLKNKPLRVDPLPYNICAGGKYENFDRVYELKNIPNKNNMENISLFMKELEKLKIPFLKGANLC